MVPSLPSRSRAGSRSGAHPSLEGVGYPHRQESLRTGAGLNFLAVHQGGSVAPRSIGSWLGGAKNMPVKKPQLIIFGPRNNATVRLNEPFPVSGQVTNPFVSGEPVQISSVTVRVDG